jgi:hypothetical protein
MRRGLLLLALAPALPSARAAAATGSGRTATEARAVGGFSAIALRGNIDLVVRQGAHEALQVSADDNLLPLLQTRVETHDGRPTLVVQWAHGQNVRPQARSVVTVDVLRLTAVSASGSGDIAVGALQTPELALSISGSSDARLDALDTQRLRIAIAGSGDVTAAGKASRLEISIAGSGDVHAGALAAADATVSIAGSGYARVHAAKTLAVSIAGSGDVEYAGGAALTRSRVAGSGSIRQRQ